MSIISSICADYSNEIKDKWVVLLKKAYEKKDWELMKEVILKIEKFHFSE